MGDVLRYERASLSTFVRFGSRRSKIAGVTARKRERREREKRVNINNNNNNESNNKNKQTNSAAIHFLRGKKRAHINGLCVELYTGI